MRENIVPLFFDLLRRELDGAGCDDVVLEEEDAEELYRLASRFDLCHLVGDALLRRKKRPDEIPDTIPDEIREKFKKTGIWRSSGIASSKTPWRV